MIFKNIKNNSVATINDKYLIDIYINDPNWVVGDEKDLPQYDNVISYDERVNQLIRERYTESNELSILRQRNEKPEDFQRYYDYCEECKIKAKEVL